MGQPWPVEISQKGPKWTKKYKCNQYLFPHTLPRTLQKFISLPYLVSYVSFFFNYLSDKGHSPDIGKSGIRHVYVYFQPAYGFTELTCLYEPHTIIVFNSFTAADHMTGRMVIIFCIFWFRRLLSEMKMKP